MEKSMFSRKNPCFHEKDRYFHRKIDVFTKKIDVFTKKIDVFTKKIDVFTKKSKFSRKIDVFTKKSIFSRKINVLPAFSEKSWRKSDSSKCSRQPGDFTNLLLTLRFFGQAWKMIKNCLNDCNLQKIKDEGKNHLPLDSAGDEAFSGRWPWL